MKSDDMHKDYQLEMSIKSLDGIPLVRVAGECDAFTAAFTHGAIVGLIDEGYKGLIIDISGLQFLDVAGFHALDDCCHKMADIGGKMYLVNPTSRVEEIYDILREQGSCEVVKTVDEALHKLQSTSSP